MSTYEVALVARVPAAVGPPALTEVGRLVTSQLTYVNELNRPGTAVLGCPLRSLTDASTARLARLDLFPSEVWIHRGTERVWAGEVQTAAVRDQGVELNCSGLLGYTSRMGVTSSLTYEGVDQFTIARGLVDHWQDLAHGHYGIVTSGVGTSGVTRTRQYLRDELHNIGTRIVELAEVIDGFDLRVSPTTRALILSYPQRGTDLSGSVFFDTRNISSAAVMLSVAPEDLVTDLSATGTRQGIDGAGTVTYAARQNATLRATYGRSWAGQNFSNVTVTETVQGHGDAYLGARGGVMFQPGVTIVPRVGADVGDFGPGDTVSYAYDAGLGLQAGAYRVSKVTTSVASSGEERMGVEFV